LNSVQFKFQNISGTAGTKFIELSSFTTLTIADGDYADCGTSKIKIHPTHVTDPMSLPVF